MEREVHILYYRLTTIWCCRMLFILLAVLRKYHQLTRLLHGYYEHGFDMYWTFCCFLLLFLDQNQILKWSPALEGLWITRWEQGLFRVNPIRTYHCLPLVSICCALTEYISIQSDSPFFLRLFSYPFPSASVHLQKAHQGQEVWESHRVRELVHGTSLTFSLCTFSLCSLVYVTFSVCMFFTTNCGKTIGRSIHCHYLRLRIQSSSQHTSCADPGCSTKLP